MSEEEECLELQKEETEVLTSIYDGDTCFTCEPEKKIYQYKFGEDGQSRSFILTMSWGPNYPLSGVPTISVDGFYNKHIFPEVSQRIVEAVTAEGEQYLGMSMTYSLFEYVKENFDNLMEDQPLEMTEAKLSERVSKIDLQEEKSSAKIEKKEQLTKAQKRRMWDKGGIDSEDRPRGWDWVCVIKHLSQSGPKE